MELLILLIGVVIGMFVMGILAVDNYIKGRKDEREEMLNNLDSVIDEIEDELIREILEGVR